MTPTSRAYSPAPFVSDWEPIDQQMQDYNRKQSDPVVIDPPRPVTPYTEPSFSPKDKKSALASIPEEP